MSDGPHRSLALRPYWKTVAERASKDVWSVEDVAEAVSRAVESDLGEIPLRPLRRILGVGQESSLFGGDPNANAVVTELEQLRGECPGSAIGAAAIDGAIVAVLDGEIGTAAFVRAIEYAQERTFRSHSRSIEEHYQRAAGNGSARHMRDRLNAVRPHCQFVETANRYTRADARRPHDPLAARRTGLDDGPAIPQ